MKKPLQKKPSIKKKSDAKPTSRPFHLLVVAHPDDESLFFGGLILANAKLRWKVICVTDGNADGQGVRRRGEFASACAALGVESFEHWDFPDFYEKRLSQVRLQTRLREFEKVQGRATRIFTHGAIGEYGHPHHQDVSFAVHATFQGHPRLFSTAYNAYPELKVELNARQFAKKAAILEAVYGSETRRFLNLLPSTWNEGFLRVSVDEVAALYRYFTGEAPLESDRLVHYRWLESFLLSHRNFPRPF